MLAAALTTPCGWVCAHGPRGASAPGLSDSPHPRKARLSLWLTGVLLAHGAISAAPAEADWFDAVVALGDSLFDDESGLRGPVSAEQIAWAMGAPLEILARSGANSTELLSQGQHTRAAAQYGAGDLALLWVGGNDFFDNALSILFGSYGFLDQLESNVAATLTTLRTAELEVVVFNLPDMSQVPAVLSAGFGLSNFRAASLQWNERLDQLAAAHGAAVLDVAALFSQLAADPASFAVLGNTPVLAPEQDCPFCVFADPIHPSALAQGFIANDAFRLLNHLYDPHQQMPLSDLSTIDLASLAGLLPGDFDGSGGYDGSDADLLVGQIVGRFDAPAFDLTGDGQVNVQDLQVWLEVAGQNNLSTGAAYLAGDANLDGVVDVADLNLWNEGKFTFTPRWTRGDFNADGVVDASDFNVWNENKFLMAGGRSSFGAGQLVPESLAGWPWTALIVCCGLRHRSRRPYAWARDRADRA